MHFRMFRGILELYLVEASSTTAPIQLEMSPNIQNALQGAQLSPVENCWVGIHEKSRNQGRFRQDFTHIHKHKGSSAGLFSNHFNNSEDCGV